MQTKAERRDNESSSADVDQMSTQDAPADRAAFDDLRAEKVVQRQNSDIANAGPRMDQQRMAASAIGRKSDGAPAPNRTGLPDQLKAGIESLSGISMDDVKVHYNSSQPAQLHAHAYAQGTDIHIAPGQERHLPHEAWHVVQQAQGRVQPTMQIRGSVLANDDEGLEREANVMGAKGLWVPALNGAASPRTVAAVAQRRRPNLIDGSTRMAAQSQAVQLAKLTPAEAVNQAVAAWKANQLNRAAKTDDWIAKADESATITQWSAEGQVLDRNYDWLVSDSESNGGSGRPSSIDLKVRKPLASDSDFIFHLPRLQDVPALINYLLASSGVHAKLKAIADRGTINLVAPSDNELRMIDDTLTVAIAPLENHPVYAANVAVINAHTPDFLGGIQSGQVDPANATLAGIRSDPNFIAAHLAKGARLARDAVMRYRKAIAPFLLVSRASLDHFPQNGINNQINLLQERYSIAGVAALLSEPQREEVRFLLERFHSSILVSAEFLTATNTLNHAIAAFVDPAGMTLETYRVHLGQQNDAAILYRALAIDEKAVLKPLLDALKNDLKTKKPPPKRAAEKDLEDDEGREKKIKPTTD
jgi:hypothetical protein